MSSLGSISLSSNLLVDIKSLDGQSKQQQCEIMDKIFRKATNGEYVITEIESFIEKSFNEIENIDHLQKLLVTVLIKCTKNTENVIKLLKSEDDYFIKRAIENCTFLWDDDKFDINFCINSIFPFISYTNRIRLVEAYAKNLKSENKVDECFKILKNKFPFSVAKSVLKYCSENLILEHLENDVSLSCNDVLKIITKRPNFVLRYMQKYSDMFRFSERLFDKGFQKVIKKLLISHPEEALKIFFHKTKLGKRIIRTLLKNCVCKNYILQNINSFSKHLKNHLVLYKYLTEEEYKIFYGSLFPPKKEFKFAKNQEIFKVLNCYGKSKEKKINLLLETFSSVYNENLLSSIKNFTPELMELLSTEKRIEFAQKLLSTCTKEKQFPEEKNPYFSNDELIIYLTCNTAIPILKEKIYFSKDKVKYLKLMLDCCKVNEDLTELLSVLKFFTQKYCNNTSLQIRVGFLGILKDYSELFKTEHWQEIHKILDHVIIKELEDYSYEYFGDLIVKNVEYQLANNLSVEEPMKFLILYSNKKHQLYPIENLLKTISRYKKQFLIKYLRLVPVVINESEICFHLKLSTISEILNWNKSHPNDIISFINYQWLCTKVEDNTNFVEAFHQLCKYDKKLSELYLEKIKQLEKGTIDNLDWYMKENPDAVFNNFDNFCDNALSNTCKSIRVMKSKKMKKYPELEEKFRNYLIDVIKTKHSANISEVIHLLMFSNIKSQEFFNLVEKYFPQNLQIDIHKKNICEDYKCQKAIAEGLYLFKNYQRIFDILRLFCRGDYLKLTIGSLNSICLRTSYYKVGKFLDSCIDTPVSFRKHIIRLRIMISNQEHVIEFLGKMWKEEKNPSIRKILLEKIWDFCISNCNLEKLELLKVCIINFNETDSLHVLQRYYQVPLEYISQYLELSWTNFKFSYGEKSIIIYYFETHLDKISASFIMNMLRDNLFETGDDFGDNYIKLAIKFVIISQTLEDEEERIGLIFEKFEKFLQTHNIHQKAVKDKTNKILRELCTVSIQNRNNYKNVDLVIIKIQNKLFEILDPSIQLYETMTRIKFTLALIQNSNDSLKDFGKNIRDIIDNEIAVYETYIIQDLAPILKSIIKSLGKENEIEKFISEVIEGLLDLPLQSIGCALIAINLVTLTDILFNKDYEVILKKLREISDRRIQIYLNSEVKFNNI